MCRRKNYFKAVDGTGVFDNDSRSMLPQTVCAELVRKHFRESGKIPKLLLIGWDGARADSMNFLVGGSNEKLCGTLFVSEYSAVNALRKEGGLYLSYAGGEPGSLQETSTAQGWASILTGEWGKTNGVLKHVPVSRACPTVLRELAERGKSAAFLAEWDDHFTITYKDEIATAKEQDLPFVFRQLGSDAQLRDALIGEIRKGTDCIFGIFEGPDANGHGYGFGNEDCRYVVTVSNLDRISYRLIEEVRARPSCPQEDWLILITSDHGGHLKTHGTQADEDRTTFIACNKKLETAGGGRE